MFDFTGIVSNVLLEQQPGATQQGTPSPNNPNASPQQQTSSNNQSFLKTLQNEPSSGFAALIAAYNTKFKSNIDSSAAEPFLQSVCAPGYFAGKTLETAGGYTFIPIFDSFLQLLTQIRTGNPKADLESIKQTLSANPAIAAQYFNQVVDQIEKTQDANIESYVPINTSLGKAKGVLDNQVDQLSKTAIAELHKDSVLVAVEKIVAKRTSVVNRISHLKGLKRPFSRTLLQPLFYSYKSFVSSTPGNLLAGLYGGWQKKISGDFQSAVDDLTSNKLMTIAILTGEYYKYLLNKVLSGQSQENQQTVNASLNLFDTFIGSILQEAPLTSAGNLAMQGGTSTPSSLTLNNQQQTQQQQQNTNQTQQQQQQNTNQTQQQQQQQQNTSTLDPKNAKEIEDMLKMVGSQKFVDYQNFVEKGTGKYFPEMVYNLGKIDEDARSGVKPAKELYDAIKGVAFYTRESIGANKTIAALGALRTGMGPVG